MGWRIVIGMKRGIVMVDGGSNGNGEGNGIVIS